LVIEIDGAHHSGTEGKEYDDNRTAVLNGYGLRVLRFKNHEVMNKLEAVCSVIDDEVQRLIKTPAEHL
jgi:very-short-patch-repair endonuclease